MWMWLLCLRRSYWRRMNLFVKFATKGFRGNRICSFISEITIFFGSEVRGQARMWKRRCMCVQSHRVCTMIHWELWAISWGSKSIFVGNIVRRSGNAINAPRSTRYGLIGKPIPRFVALGSTNAIVGLCSPGFCFAFAFPFDVWFKFQFVNVIVEGFWDCWSCFGFFILWRRDSFITNRVFCDALAEVSARAQTQPVVNPNSKSNTKIQAVDDQGRSYNCHDPNPWNINLDTWLTKHN